MVLRRPGRARRAAPPPSPLLASLQAVRAAALLIVPLAVVGLVATVVAVAAHESDAAFVFKQQNPSQVSALELETLINKAREPVAGGQGSATTEVKCAPG